MKQLFYLSILLFSFLSITPADVKINDTAKIKTVKQTLLPKSQLTMTKPGMVAKNKTEKKDFFSSKIEKYKRFVSNLVSGSTSPYTLLICVSPTLSSSFFLNQ